MGLFDKLRARSEQRRTAQLEAEHASVEQRLRDELFAMSIEEPEKRTVEFKNRRYVLEITKTGERKFSVHEPFENNGKKMWRYNTVIYTAAGEQGSARTGVYPASFANR